MACWLRTPRLVALVLTLLTACLSVASAAGAQTLSHHAVKKHRSAHRRAAHRRHRRAVTRRVRPRVTQGRAATAGCPDLFWPAPRLSSPITIRVPASGGGEYVLDNRRDYQVILPAGGRTGQVRLDGGRNITVLGGRLHNDDGPEPALIYLNDQGQDGPPVRGRTIDVEHVALDLSGGRQHDAIALEAPSAIVQLEDIHVTGVHGAGVENHSDIVQNYGPVGELRVDRLTGETNYQGFFIRPQEGAIGKVTLRRVNLQLDPNPIDAYSQLLFLTDPDGQTDPISFDQVYVDNTRPGQTGQDAVFPDSTAHLASDFVGNTVGFPRYPNLHGTVQTGQPPAGNFACV